MSLPWYDDDYEAHVCPKCGGLLEESEEDASDPKGASDEVFYQLMCCKNCGQKVNLWRR